MDESRESLQTYPRYEHLDTADADWSLGSTRWMTEVSCDHAEDVSETVMY